MEKLKKFVSSIKLAYLVVIAATVKALCETSSNWTDFFSVGLIVAPLLAFDAYNLYLKSKKPDPILFDAELRKELDNMKSKLSALSMEKNVKPQQTRYF